MRLAPSPLPLCIAHRGSSHTAPENTLAAVRLAVAQRADLVEVDVHRTRDGALVVIHDTTLHRTTDAQKVFRRRSPWRVGELTLDEIRRLDAGSWKHPRFAGERVPTLEEVIAVLRGTDVGLLVEVKTPALYPGIASDVVATLQGAPGFLDHALSHDKLVVQSFDVAAMKEHKTRLPAVPVGLLGSPASSNLPALGSWANQVNPSHLSVHKGYVDAVHRAGMTCHTWTIDSAGAMRRALRAGVDGVITNRPPVLSRCLR